MGQALATQTEPEVMNAPEERALAAWQAFYPDRWLLAEVTHEEDGEPLTGHLLTMASTDMALVPVKSFFSCKINQRTRHFAGGFVPA